jgi:cyclic pyranopterin monophosphate synthase
MQEELTHLDDQGRISMVDVGGKPIQSRLAHARGEIALADRTRQLISAALIKKGDALTTAEIAGIQAAKQTSGLIPLCHPLITDHIKVKAALTATGAVVDAEVRCHGRTGAEMEALTAVSVALLTIYDMCKAVDKKMVIHGIHLVRKEKS